MRLVVDASAIVPVILAGGVLGPLEPHELTAPPLLISEVTSAVSEMAWRGVIPREHGRAALSLLISLSIRIERPEDLPERAWDVAEALGWAKTYDAEYVALAVRHDIPLVTLDQRLWRGAKRLAQTFSPLELPSH